jgi:ABC-2 type transport system ATP-binding protein
MNDSIVSVQELVKKYGPFTAVNGLSLEIQRGEVFGLLGANGAGKTTTFECIEGLRAISDGNIRVAGCNPQTEPHKLRKRLGVQLQSSSLPESIRIGEAIELTCAWQHTPVPKDLIRAFDAEDLLKKQYRQLSTGQKRRAHLILALCNRPEVLILDEPTAGLDVQNRAKLHEQIHTIRKKGVTVLLATHDMAEAQTLCDRIAILVHEKIAVCGTPETITSSGNQSTRVRLRTAKNSLIPGFNIGNAVFTGEKDSYLEWTCKDVSADIIHILNCVQAKDDSVEDLRVERPTLEERFLELAEGAQA